MRSTKGLRQHLFYMRAICIYVARLPGLPGLLRTNQICYMKAFGAKKEAPASCSSRRGQSRLAGIMPPCVLSEWFIHAVSLCAVAVAGSSVSGIAPARPSPAPPHPIPPTPPAPLPPAPKGGYKNVLFIPVDDLRPEISAYGHAYMKTPHLDQLAADGTVFTRAFVQYSFCGPSRNSFLTGRRPDATKAWSFMNHFREEGVGDQWKSTRTLFPDAV